MGQYGRMQAESVVVRSQRMGAFNVVWSRQEALAQVVGLLETVGCRYLNSAGGEIGLMICSVLT